MCANGQIKVQNFYIDYLLNSFALTKNVLVINPNFFPPESLRGEQLKKSSDIFSLGALAYRLLSGHTPYPEIENVPMLLRNLKRKPESLIVRNPDIPLYLEDIIFKALEYNPTYRHQSVLEFLGDLQAKKVTIRVEEIKLREQLSQQRKTTAKQSNNPTPKDPEINAPPINFQKRDRQIPPSNYNNRTMPKTPSGPQVPSRPHPKPKNIVILVVVFSIFLGLVISIIQALFANYFNSIPKIQIPNVIGQPLEEANNQLQKVGLKPKVIGQVADNNISENCVVTTIPEHGRVVKKNRLIKIYISKAAEQLTVPALVESNLNQIEAIIKEKGFNLKVEERRYSTEYPPNIIISQNPEPHTAIRKGSEISIVVSKGYPVGISLIDKNEDTAIVKISAENLPGWEAQQVIIYLQDRKGRNKIFEKVLAPGEKLAKEITTEPDAVVEVYYYNNLALKQELKTLEAK
ncbi:serine/threonine-protein kinase [sediment metagenome]|uniref:Serine/threonine-protein kinase n=1 Tax=sediment metagenome TaxID=749907 RepID=D9PMC2_9ZZZZ